MAPASFRYAGADGDSHGGRSMVCSSEDAWDGSVFKSKQSRGAGEFEFTYSGLPIFSVDFGCILPLCVYLTYKCCLYVTSEFLMICILLEWDVVLICFPKILKLKWWFLRVFGTSMTFAGRNLDYGYDKDIGRISWLVLKVKYVCLARWFVNKNNLQRKTHSQVLCCLSFMFVNRSISGFLNSVPKPSMYGRFAYIYHSLPLTTAKCSYCKYTIHRWYGVCISVYIQNRTYLPDWSPNSNCEQCNNPISFAVGRCQYVVPLTCMAAYTYIIYAIVEMKIVPENVKDIYITKSLSLWVLRYFFVIWHIISSSWDVVSQGVHSVAPTQLHLLRCRAGPCAVKVPCAMPWKNFWRTQWEGMRAKHVEDAGVGRSTWIPESTSS